MPSYKITVDGRPLELNARPDRLDLRDRTYNPPLRPLPKQFPSEEDIERFLEFYEPLILDQRADGACTGFGLAAVINYQRWFQAFVVPYWQQLQRGVSPEAAVEELKRGYHPKRLRADLVSTRMLYQMARLYDEWDGEDYSGSSCRGAMRGWYHHGVCLETTWNYKRAGHLFEDGKTPNERNAWLHDAAERPLGAYYRIASDSIPDMQAAIQQVHAIYVSAYIHDGWTEHPVAGRSTVDRESKTPHIINWTEGKAIRGGHAFAIVGYTQDGFMVQNSWGRRWGSRGFAILRYEDWKANGLDAWACVYGAPTKMERPSKTKSLGSLQTSALRARRPNETNYHTRTAPWNQNMATLHSIFLGKNGRAVSRLVHAGDGAEHLLICASKRVLRYCAAEYDYNDIVIYAHSGLDDEVTALHRTAALGPWFMANGIFPLFLSSSSGLLSDLNTQFRDAIGLQKQKVSGGYLSPSELDRQIKSTNDYTWEAIASSTSIRAIWTELKENAALSAQNGGGLWMLADHLKDLRQKYRELRIHLVGHSAGAFAIGGLTERLRRLKVPVHSATLWAPACSMQFAAKTFGPSLKQNVFGRDRFVIEVLPDASEQEDGVAGLYQRSFLYLVSRALERQHKTPLLGLSNWWWKEEQNESYPSREARRAAVSHPDVRAWQDIWQDREGYYVLHAPFAFDQQDEHGANVRQFKLTHCTFDRSILGMEAAMKLMLGPDREPRHRITDLSGV